MRGRWRDGPWPIAGVLAVGAPVGVAAAYSPLLALAGFGSAILAALVFLRAYVLLLILVAALPWEDALDWPSQEITVVKLLGLLLFGAWALRTTVRDDRLVLTPSMIPVAVFAFAIGISLIASPDPGAGVIKSLRYALFFLFFFLVIQLVPNRREVRRTLAVLCVSAAVAAGWALYLFLIVGDIGRAAGPISDPNDFANLLVATLPLAGYLLATSRGARRVLWCLAIALITAALLATLSRGALAGLTVVAIWGVVTRRVPVGGFIVLAGVVIAVVGLVLAIWGPLVQDRLDQKGRIADRNVEARLAFWIAAGRMAADEPVTGVGPNRFGAEAAKYVRKNPLVLPNPVTHNSYLEILAESGIFALLAFLAYLATTWGLLARSRRQARAIGDREGERLASAMQATWIVATVSSMFLSAQLTTPFWLIGGLATVVAAVAVPSTARTGPEPEPGPEVRPPALPVRV